MKIMEGSILIIDDDKDLSEITGDTLAVYGYQVSFANSCEEAFELLTTNTYQLILLDINLPDGTGFQVCQELRRVSNVPVIFASARTSEDDKIQGLDIGGDDYLAKPYSLKELLSRINALMRRTYGAKEGEKEYSIGTNISVSVSKRQVIRDDKPVKLSLKEFDLLRYLCENSGRALTKEELLREVWGTFSEAEMTTVAVHIRWLREKLEENPSKPQYIQTVWGVGYQLELGEK